MLCEKCPEREAMVHVKGGRPVDSLSGALSVDQEFEHHFCEVCASGSPLVNPTLEYGPDAISEQVRVIRVSAERTRVEDYDYGRFAWITDPEGNRIELWESK